MRRLALATCLVAAISVSAEQADATIPLAIVLQRAGEQVEKFFLRAQSLVCTEIVRMTPLDAAYDTRGALGRTVESELRLSWAPGSDGAPSAEAKIQRQVVRVNGRKPDPKDWRNCTTPEQQDQETQDLSMLLPAERSKYEFKNATWTKVDGRVAIQIDFRFLKRASVKSELQDGREDCISFEIDGGTRGRLWIDSDTFDVLRLDQGLDGLVDIPLPRLITRKPGVPLSWTAERMDKSIRFKRVAFADPEETLVLPVSETELQIMRGSGTPRLRTTTDYTNYQRFLTKGRVVGDN